MASRELYSKDIVALRIYDQIDQYYIPKEKIVFGPDGTAIDVTYDTPFPVLGSFSPQTWSSFGSGTPTQISVGTSSTVLLIANGARRYALIVNNSARSIYIQYGIAAVWKTGWVLRPNAMWEINTSGLFTGAINAITDVGTVDIDVLEGV